MSLFDAAQRERRAHLLRYSTPQPTDTPPQVDPRVKQHLGWLRGADSPRNLFSVEAAFGVAKRRTVSPLRPNTAASRATGQPTQHAVREQKRLRSEDHKPFAPEDADPCANIAPYETLYGGLQGGWQDRCLGADGFEALVKSIDRVLPYIEEGTLGEKWRALAEWVERFANDRHAPCVADRCRPLLHMDPEGNSAQDQCDQRSGEQRQSVRRRLTGMKQAATAVAMAQRVRIAARRKEIAGACVALDQLLVFAGRCHPCLWPVARKTRHVLLSLFFGLKEGVTLGLEGQEEEWVDNPADLVVVPQLYCRDDRGSVRAALQSYLKRKSWYEIAQDLQRRLGILRDDIESTETSTGKLVRVMERGIKFWQGVVQSVLLRHWRAARRYEKRVAAASQHAADAVRLEWRKDKAHLLHKLQSARHDADAAAREKYQKKLLNLESLLDDANARTERWELRARNLESQLAEAQTKYHEVHEAMDEKLLEIEGLNTEIQRYKRLCSDFIRVSLEGPDWIVSRQEEMSKFAQLTGGAAESAEPVQFRLPRALGRKSDPDRHPMPFPNSPAASGTPSQSPAAHPTPLVPPAAVPCSPQPVVSPSASSPSQLGGIRGTGPTPPAGLTPLVIDRRDSVEGIDSPSAGVGAFLFSPRRRKRRQSVLSPQTPGSPGTMFSHEEMSAGGVLPQGITREDLAMATAARDEGDFVLEWFNACINACGYPGAEDYKVKSFTGGHRLLEPYVLVMHYMSPGGVTASMVSGVIAEAKDVDKARMVLAAAENLDMVFPLTPYELINPQAREQHLLIAAALFQRFSDPHLAFSCGMRPLQPPVGVKAKTPLWPEGSEITTAREWRKRMHEAWSRSLRWRGAGAAAQSLATEALLSKVQGREGPETPGDIAVRQWYVDDPLAAWVVDSSGGSPVEKLREFGLFHNILAEHYPMIRRVYLFYSTGDHLDVELSVDELFKMFQDAKMVGGKMFSVSRQHCEDIFRKVLDGTGKSTLHPKDFVLVLLRLAEVKKSWISLKQASCVSRFRSLLEEYLLANANYLGLDEFRRIIYSDKCAEVLDRNRDLVLATFRAYATQGSLSNRLMTLKDFTEVVGMMNVVDASFSHEQVRSIFAKVQNMDDGMGAGGHTVLVAGVREHVLSYRQFLECVSMVAMFKSPLPYLPTCRRLSRFFDGSFVPTFNDSKLWKVKGELQRIKQR